MGFNRTSKFLDAHTLGHLRELSFTAQNTPAILLSQKRLGPLGKTEAQIAWELFYEAVDEAAVAAGFPTPEQHPEQGTIHYGVDFHNGELLTWDGKDDD